jgi:hypothetical protein
MRRLLLVGALVLATGCGGRKEPVRWDRLAGSDAVKLLRADDNPYRIIYYPPVDLTKKPAS